MSKEYRPETCANARETIEDNGLWLTNVDLFLDEGDDGYDDQQSDLSAAYSAIEHAFNSRPGDCRMERTNNDNFACEPCRFYCDLD